MLTVDKIQIYYLVFYGWLLFCYLFSTSSSSSFSFILTFCVCEFFFCSLISRTKTIACARKSSQHLHLFTQCCMWCVRASSVLRERFVYLDSCFQHPFILRYRARIVSFALGKYSTFWHHFDWPFGAFFHYFWNKFIVWARILCVICHTTSSSTSIWS